MSAEPQMADSAALQQAYQAYSVCYQTYLKLLQTPDPSLPELQLAHERLQTATETYAELLGVDVSQLDPTLILPPPTTGGGTPSSPKTAPAASAPLLRGASGTRETTRSTAARLYQDRLQQLQQVMGQRAATADEKQGLIVQMAALANREAGLGFWDFFKKWEINGEKRKLGKRIEHVERAHQELLRREQLLKGDVLNLGRVRDSRFVVPFADRFYFQGEPFVPFGFNSYDLFTRNPTDRVEPSVYDDFFRTLSERGVNLVRTWVFNSGEWHGFHTSIDPPGYGTENQWQILDAIIESAGKHNVRLLLCLGNYWKDYGGSPWYLKQAGLPADPNKPEQMIEFFRNGQVKRSYRVYLRQVIQRVNSRTGIAYAADPTIFAWELINEPRCPADPDGNTLRGWIDEMAGLVRSLDDEHMISAGLEGSDPDFSGGNEGTPFIYLHQSPHLSFTTAHLYPEYHFPKLSARKSAEIIAGYLDASASLEWQDPDGNVRKGKPFLLEESNVQADWRQEYWSTLAPLLHSRKAGFLVWNYFPEPSDNADEFGVYPDDDALFRIIQP